MKTSNEIIKEIKDDAANLQKKLLLLPGVGSCNAEQTRLIDKAQETLRGFRGWELGELEKAFSEESNGGKKEQKVVTH